MPEIVDELEVPRTLRMSRRRMLPPFLGCLAFVAGCSVLLVAGDDSAKWNVFIEAALWVGIAFFGLGLVLFALELIRPSRLFLDNEGFSYRPPWRPRSRETRWMDCGPFSSWGAAPRRNLFGSSESVMYHRTDKPQSALERANYEITDGAGGAAIRAGFDDLGGADLAALLNRYRARYGTRQ